MNMITRNIPDDLHHAVKVAAAVEKRSLNETVISLLTLKAAIGDPRQAALDNVEFRLVPHRSNDGQDTPEVWSWKLQALIDGKLDSAQIL